MAIERDNQALTIGRPAGFYPSPFFDAAQQHLPKTIKEMMDWCVYYQLTSPLVNAVTAKLATYAITDLVYPDGPEAVLYKDLFEDTLGLRTFLVEHNLDRLTCGNGFASVVFPLIKYLSCVNCKFEQKASKVNYKFRGFQFHISCRKCGHTGVAKARDVTVQAPRKIRLVRWNPKHITIRYNEITGERRYFYSMPRYLRNDLHLGNVETVESTPQAFIDALAGNKIIQLDADKLFHSRRPSVSRDPGDEGWGVPLLLPVLKDLFLLQVLKKAQEVVMMEYVIPFRSLHPDVRADGNNVYGNVNLKDWQKAVEGEIQKWKRDPGHIAVLPVPIGQQIMGGQGRSLMLHQEIRAYSDMIIAGLGVPTGFFYGEAMYSGASVNMRAMENEFITNRQDMEHLVDFIIRRIAHGLGRETVKVNFKTFKMADDIQRAGLDMQMVGQQMLSLSTFMQSRDYDPEKEKAQVDIELKEKAGRAAKAGIEQARVQAQMAQVQARGQLAAQAVTQPQPPPAQNVPPPGAQPLGAPGIAPSQLGAQSLAPQTDILAQADVMVTKLQSLDEVTRYRLLMQLRSQMPDLYQVVNDRLNNNGGSGMGAASAQPMKPLPEQLPSRAGPGRAQI